MKCAKVEILLLLSLLMISLPSCSKSEEAQAVDDMIAAIGEVTKGSENSIQKAEEAYTQLEDADKKSLSNYGELQKARTAYDTLCAQEVDELIEKIGTVTLDSKKDIEAALSKYDSLTENQKELVNNCERLMELENEYSAVQINEVEQNINTIGTITFTSDCRNAIYAARKVYNELSTDQQKEVKNYPTLTKFENEFTTLGITTMEQLIDGIGEVKFTEECEEAIKAAEQAGRLLDAEQKSKVKNYGILEEAREKYNALTPVQVNSYRLRKDIIGNPEISFNVTNNTDKIVKEYTVRVFAYDNDNVPVKIYFNDFTRRLNDTDSLKPGVTKNVKGYWQFYGEYNEIKQIVGYVDEVEFYDGTTWENPQDNNLFDKYNEKILVENDANILTRG